jgi:four helix bundle protein
LLDKIRFPKIAIYQKAKVFHEAAKELINAKKLSPYSKDQLARASFSIILNIAEGSGGLSKADRRNFFIITRSFVFECVAILDILKG